MLQERLPHRAPSSTATGATTQAIGAAARDLAEQTARSFVEASTPLAGALKTLTSAASGTVFSAAGTAGSAMARHASALETAAAALLGTADVACLTGAVLGVGMPALVSMALAIADDFSAFAGFPPPDDRQKRLVVDATVAIALGGLVAYRYVMFGNRDVAQIGRDHAQWAAAEPDLEPIVRAASMSFIA